MIEVNNLSFQYPNSDVKAVDNVSFEFPNKGLFYIIGESGSGKSTFLHLLSGLETNYEGSILVEGKEMRELSSKEREMILFDTISISIQDDLFQAEEKAKDSLLLPLEISDLSYGEKLDRVEENAKLLSINTLLDKKISSLSGGEKKRLSLARALVKDYSILLLDEPLGPLDKKMRERVTKVIKDISKNKLVIVVSHSLSEIKKDDNVLSFSDGKMEVIHLNKKEGYTDINYEKRRKRKYSLSSIFKAGLKTIFSFKRRSFSSISASSLALVSLGLISIISSSISTGLKSYLTGESSKNTMMVERRKEEITSPSSYPVSYQDSLDLFKAYPDSIYGIGAYYDLNFENTFTSFNKVYISDYSYNLNINSLQGRSFMEFTYFRELGKEYEYLEDECLEKDEIVLGLSSFDTASIVNFLHIEDDDYIKGINKYITDQGLYLHLELGIGSIGYNLDDSFEVKKVVSASRTQIIHTDSMFGESFVEDDMHFSSTSDNSGIYPNPWTVYKDYFLFIKKDDKGKLIESIYQDERFDDFIIKSMKTSWPFYNKDQEEEKDDRLVLLRKGKSGINYSDVKDIEKKYEGFITSCYLSDSFYYCSSQISSSGFLKPVYVSSSRELLNKIADYNYQAKFDLAGFQGSTIVFDEGVVMGDLSRTKDSPLRFSPYEEDPILLKGKRPENYKEVLISSKLASYLYSNTSKALNQTLFMTCLKETVIKDGGYKNIFVDGKVKISGIVEDEENNYIYQRPRFLQDLELEQFSFDEQLVSTSYLMIYFKEGIDPIKEKEILSKIYPEYKFSLPVKEMSDSIDKIIDYIGKGLLAFALFSGLIASVLISMVIILFISEGQKRILMMLNIGFSLSDVKNYYMGLALLLTGISYVASSIFLLGFSFIFAKSLNGLLGVEVGVFLPRMFLFNFLFSVILTLVSFSIINFKLEKFKKKK